MKIKNSQVHSETELCPPTTTTIKQSINSEVKGLGESETTMKVYLQTKISDDVSSLTSQIII